MVLAVRQLAPVKSLLSFAHRIGYLPFDVGRPLRLPKLKDGLAARILSEGEVFRMIDLEPRPRNQTILKVLYVGGLRVSELCSLKWEDAMERNGGAGQLTIFGKGGKTRAVLLPAGVWSDLLALRKGDAEQPIFSSRAGTRLSVCQVMRIVRSAAARASIKPRVSPHWLRHAHASHALDHGAPIHLIQATLGHSSIATTGRYLHAKPSDSSGRFLVGLHARAIADSGMEK